MIKYPYKIIHFLIFFSLLFVNKIEVHLIFGLECEGSKIDKVRKLECVCLKLHLVLEKDF